MGQLLSGKGLHESGFVNLFANRMKQKKTSLLGFGESHIRNFLHNSNIFLCVLCKEQVLRLEHGSETSALLVDMTDEPTDRPTDRPIDRPGQVRFTSNKF